MKNIAVYAGTFDPVTYGHIDLVERGARLFDEIIVGIAISQNKKTLFELDERVQLAQAALSSIPNVKVMGFNSLLLDFASKHQARVILRGLRTVTDFDYEFQLASMNRFLNPKIESMFLVPSEKYMYISSTLVREIASLGGDIKGFVPPVIAAALYQKFQQQKEV